MNTRNLLNLALLVIAALLALLVLQRPGIEDNTGGGRVSKLDPDHVRHILLQRNGAEPLEFSRGEQGWRIDGHPALPADDFQVHTVLALLEAEGVRSYPAESLGDLSALGLDPPQVTVTFDNTPIHVGDTEPVNNLRYLLVGNTVYLVADRFQHLARAGFSNYVDRTLLPDPAQITALELPGLTLRLVDGIHWQLQPPRPDVSADDIDAFIDTWRRARALYVQRYNMRTAEAAEKKDKPEIIRVTQGEPRPVEFQILKRTPDLVLARPEWDVEYHLPAASAAKLLDLVPYRPGAADDDEPMAMEAPDTTDDGLIAGSP